MQEYLSTELLAKIRGIQIRAKHLVNDVFAGEYKSAFKGRGLEFEEVREYQMGDDIRSIDWNVTARANKPFIKLYRDERELTVMFIIDVSASARFGTLEKFKNEIAAEIAALLAYTALRNNDKVGLIIFSDHVEHFIPPQKGRAHIWRLIRDILTFESKSKSTNISGALEYLNRVIRKRCITFVISDFDSKEYQTQLRLSAKHHEVVAIGIKDRHEVTLPNIGFVEFFDAETGEPTLIDTGRNDTRNRFQKNSAEEERDTRNFFRSAGIDYISLQTDSSAFDKLIQYFRNREKKRR
jgi:uncharacterized protein (DUF58 family)